MRPAALILNSVSECPMSGHIHRVGERRAPWRSFLSSDIDIDVRMNTMKACSSQQCTDDEEQTEIQAHLIIIVWSICVFSCVLGYTATCGSSYMYMHIHMKTRGQPWVIPQKS